MQNEPGVQDAAALFSGRASSFGVGGVRRFPHFGRRLVETAGVSTGLHVLDVAMGRGALLFPAAELVGPTGRVVGTDLAPGMVQATAKDVEQRGLTNVEVRQMDAEQLDFPDGSFDALVCGFGIMFFPHLEQALAGFHRVLRPGGRLAISTWAKPDPAFAWELELWRTYGIAERRPDRFMAQRLDQASELGAVLADAGFHEIEVRHELDTVSRANEDEWWELMNSPGVLRDALDSIGPEQGARFQADAYQHLRPLRGQDGISQRIEALFGLARNP